MRWQLIVGLMLIAWGVMASLDDMMVLAGSMIPAGLGAGLLAWNHHLEQNEE